MGRRRRRSPRHRVPLLDGKDTMIATILLGVAAGLFVSAILIWWVARTLWDSYQTIRAARRIRRIRG